MATWTIMRSGASRSIIARGVQGPPGATGPAGPSAWGGITGSITSQTDLQSVLNAKQDSDPTLTAFAALTIDANVVPYGTGGDAFATTPLTAFARTILDDVDAASVRATIGLDGGASVVFSSVSAGGNTLSDVGAVLAVPLSTQYGGFGTNVSAVSGVPLFSPGFGPSFTGTTGSGNFVRATSAALVTPALGTPSAAVLTNATGLPISTGLAGGTAGQLVYATGSAAFACFSPITLATSGRHLLIQAAANGDVSQAIRLKSGQTANLFQLETTDGNWRFAYTKDCYMAIGDSSAAFMVFTPNGGTGEVGCNVQNNNFVGLTINGAGSPNADLARICSSQGGTIYTGWDKRGRNFTGGTTPTIAAGAGAGTSPTVSLSNATDAAGIISITTGATPSNASTVATITFSTAFAAAPRVVTITPCNAAAEALTRKPYWGTVSTTAFTLDIGATALPASSGPYLFSFTVQG